MKWIDYGSKEIGVLVSWRNGLRNTRAREKSKSKSNEVLAVRDSGTPKNDKMMILTVKEAVARVQSGQNLEGFVLEENSMKQVNVRDAMVLSEGGIVIPEQNIFYDDDDIEYDKEIDELVITNEITGLSWEEKARRAKTSL